MECWWVGNIVSYAALFYEEARGTHIRSYTEKCRMDDLRCMLKHLIGHPELVEKSGQESKVFIEQNYTWGVIAQKMRSFYEALVYSSGFRETQV